VSGFAPEIPVLSNRAFAAGLPSWIPGYYTAADDLARAKAQLRGEDGAVVVLLEGAATFRASWPALAEELDSRGVRPYTVRAAEKTIDVWLPAAASNAAHEAATGLPCAIRR
jgi:hypothetical protein